MHFLQIWALPSKPNLPPAYFTRHFPDASKLDTLRLIVAPSASPGVTLDREGTDTPTPVHSSLYFYASLVSPRTVLEHAVLPPVNPRVGGKLVYVQLVQTSGYNTAAALKDGARVRVAGGGSVQEIGEGDGVFIRGAVEGETLTLENVSGKMGEVVLFEMDA